MRPRSARRRIPTLLSSLAAHKFRQRQDSLEWEQVLNIGNQFVRRNVRYCRTDNNQVKRAVIQQSQCPAAGARHRDLVSAQVQVERNFLQRVSIHNQDVSARSWRLKILFDHNTAVGVPSLRMLSLPLKYSKRKRSHRSTRLTPMRNRRKILSDNATRKVNPRNADL